MAVYDWATKRKLCDAKIDPDKIFDAVWKDDTEVAMAGMKCVKFVTF